MTSGESLATRRLARVLACWPPDWNAVRACLVAGAAVETRTLQDGADRAGSTAPFFLARRGWRAGGSRAKAISEVIKRGPMMVWSLEL